MTGFRNDFKKLREQIYSRGYNLKTPLPILGEWLLFVAMTIVGVAILINTDSWWLNAFAMCLLIFSGMGIATIAHTASHHAISEKMWINNFFLYFGYPFFFQLSAAYWHKKHLVIHHPHPNVVGVDCDANLAPIFALDQAELVRVKGVHHFWYRHQGYFLPFVLAFSAFGVVLKGWRFLFRRLRNPATRVMGDWLDLGLMLLHWVVWLIVPMYYFTPTNVLAFNLIRLTATSYGMFILFAPAHYPIDALLLDKHALNKDFLMLQTITTINFRTGWLGRLVCGGVEFQIEHHLFPSISPRHYPSMSHQVKRFCDEHGYSYRTQGWAQATWQSIVTFWRPKPIQAELPSPQQNHASGSM